MVKVASIYLQGRTFKLIFSSGEDSKGKGTDRLRSNTYVNWNLNLKKKRQKKVYVIILFQVTISEWTFMGHQFAWAPKPNKNVS